MSVAALLVNAERDGIRLALRGRLIILVAIGLWFLLSRPYPIAVYLAAVVALFAVVGMVQALIIGTRFDRPWTIYAFIAFDILVLVCAIVFTPLSSGGVIPAVFVFRNDYVPYLFLVLAIVSLSLSPRLVLWAAVILVASWWAGCMWIVSKMERTLSWADMEAAPALDDYDRIFLNADFIGTGSRVQETLVLYVTALVISLPNTMVW